MKQTKDNEIGLRIYRAEEPNEKFTSDVLSTYIRPLVGESLMVHGQRVQIVDIAVNTSTFIKDILNVYVTERTFP